MRSAHLSERVDVRSFYLRLQKTLWIPLLMTVVGAFAGLLIYFLATTVFGPGRAYRAESRLYINFSKELEESAYPYYNDYTWRDLIVTDELLDGTMEGLRQQGFTIAEESDPNDMGSRVLSEAEIKASTFATLPSDIRLMIVQYTNHDPVVANALMDATDRSIVAYASRHKEFDSIEIRSEDVAQIITYEDRTIVAIVTGAVIGLLAGLFSWAVKELFNDAVYTPKELAERFRFPVTGVLLKDAAGKSAVKTLLDNDLSDALQGLAAKGMQRLFVVAADQDADADAAVAIVRQMNVACPEGGAPAISAAACPGESADALQRLREADGVLLAIRAGVNRSTMTERCIAALCNAGIPIAGLLLTEAEEGFLRSYYRVS